MRPPPDLPPVPADLRKWLQDGKRLLAEYEATPVRPVRDIARLKLLMGNACARQPRDVQGSLSRARLWWP